ncbi:MAG: transposase [Nitrososphaerota archaeon]|jgi:transposase|nr:transposase [Nitrososphaerota archaeon]
MTRPKDTDTLPCQNLQCKYCQKEKDKNTIKHGKNPGAQKGHKDHGLKIQKQPDQTIQHKPQQCKHCQTNLTQIPGTQTDTRYKNDINIQTNLTKHNQITITCPNCQTPNTKPYPKNLTSTIQYGKGVKAISVLFTHYAMDSYDKTQKILNDIFDIPISTGTIVNHVAEFTQKAEPILNEIPQRLHNEKVLHFDETGPYVEGINSGYIRHPVVRPHMLRFIPNGVSWVRMTMVCYLGLGCGGS